MTSTRQRFCLVALAASLAALPATARADHQIDRPFTGTRPLQLELHGGFSWFGFGFAAGARFGIPLMHNGFVPSLDNAVYLNFGGDFYFVDHYYWDDQPGVGRVLVHSYGVALGFPVALHWEFYFNDTWSAFAELGLNVYFPPSVFRGYGFEYRDHAGAWVLAQVGGTLHLGEVFALTLRVGTPYVSFGFQIHFG